MVEPEMCSNCNITIHANYIGYHKCGYYNCPICKDQVLPIEYEKHILGHTGVQQKYKQPSYVDPKREPKSKPKYKDISTGRYMKRKYMLFPVVSSVV
jgi:hypothetical protein